ncbi:hypothetical protein HDK64DRAFT_299103 [Phyllosticta capitalensis]|uniref:Uncharacterized protein n=1 Tax=Phyllosticta capitalensis TaxID=121624 RepID=A0ABR1YN02_9PEZI
MLTHRSWLSALLPTLIAALILTADASMAPARTDAIEIYPDTLVDMLLRAPVHEPQVFEVAQKRIRDMESSPACQQLATSTLIDSCQSLDLMAGSNSHSTSQNPMDVIKREYSARLAVCELQGIKDGVPKECRPFVPSADACGNTGGFFGRYSKSSKGEKRRLCYPNFTQQELKTCANALFNHPQRWTSFSNARSNAIIICQASRAAVENDEYLRKLRDATEAQSGAAEALVHVVSEVQAALGQQKAFAESVERFQSDIITKNEAALAQSDHLVGSIFSKVESSAQSMLFGFQRYFDGLKNEANALDSVQNLKGAGAQVHQVQNGLAHLDTSLAQHQGQVEAVQYALQHILDATIRDLADRVVGIEDTLKSQLVLSQQALEDQRAFQQIQAHIMDNHTAISDSLRNQRLAIEENSQRIKDMPFAGIGSIIATYLGLSLAFIVMLNKAATLLRF